MAKLNIIYFTTTGNTEEIAKLIEEGAKTKGVETELIPVDSANENSVDADFVAFGSPATGAEEVAQEMLDYVNSVKDKLSGKTVGLFGSNDWGTGEFMESWVSELGNDNISVVNNGLVINLSPDEDEKIESAKEYGVAIVQ